MSRFAPPWPSATKLHFNVFPRGFWRGNHHDGSDTLRSDACRVASPTGAFGDDKRDMKLRAFQEEIKELVFFREKEPAASRLWKEKVPERLDVYRNNTRTNWTETLDHDFPLTQKQFTKEEWEALRRRYFIKHPPQHWELNTSIAPFTKFLAIQKVKPYVKELADYEWHDLQVFIDRSIVRRGAGVTNPTAVVRVYQHQIFYWAEAGAPAHKPPLQKPEVLVFYRDSKNTCHIREADPLMLLVIDHFRKPGARLDDLEPARRKLLPDNQVPLQNVLAALQKSELILPHLHGL